MKNIVTIIFLSFIMTSCMFFERIDIVDEQSDWVTDFDSILGYHARYPVNYTMQNFHFDYRSRHYESKEIHNERIIVERYPNAKNKSISTIYKKIELYDTLNVAINDRNLKKFICNNEDEEYYINTAYEFPTKHFTFLIATNSTNDSLLNIFIKYFEPDTVLLEEMINNFNEELNKFSTIEDYIKSKNIQVEIKFERPLKVNIENTAKILSEGYDKKRYRIEPFVEGYYSESTWNCSMLYNSVTIVPSKKDSIGIVLFLKDLHYCNVYYLKEEWFSVE